MHAGREAQMNSDRPSSPYVGLAPYTEQDVRFFFGREVDTEVITSNLRAAKLTLLYGGSGVGKSSLLNAGVAHHLRTISKSTAQRKGAPEFVIVIFRDWVKDPVRDLSKCVQETVGKVFPDLAAVSVPPTRDLSQMLATWQSLTRATLFIILDQFEEYFQRPEKSTGEGSFAFEFPRAIARTDTSVKFLISMRDDSLAKLDFFKASIPGLFDNRLQVKHLDKQAAENAIRKPIAKFNELYEETFDIEDQLVEQVLKDVEVRNVKFSTEGQARTGGEAEQSIETPYLQLVMTGIWQKEKELNSKKLRLETLTRELGGSQRIVDTHLDDVVNALPLNQRDLAAKFMHFTVTRYGTKIAVDAATLAEWAELPGKELEINEVLEDLGTGPARIYRRVALQPAFVTETTTKAVDFFEIYHDALIPSLLSWRKRYVEERNKQLTQFRIRKEEEEKRSQLLKEEEAKRHQLIQRHTYQRKIAGLIALVIALLVILVGYILIDRAKEKAQEAQEAIRRLEEADSRANVAAENAGKERKIRKFYEGQTLYYKSVTRILRDLSSKSPARQKSALDILQKKAKEDGLTAAHVKLFTDVVSDVLEKGNPTRQQVLDALKNSEVLKPSPADDSFILIVIQIHDNSQYEAAEKLSAILERDRGNKDYSVIVPSIDRYSPKFTIRTTQLCFYHKSAENRAKEMIAILEAVGIKAEPRYIPNFEMGVRPNQFELWFSQDQILISDSMA